jgi:hypothetical protein
MSVEMELVMAKATPFLRSRRMKPRAARQLHEALEMQFFFPLVSSY